MREPPFVAEHRASIATLRVAEPLFSKGTYQVEVQEAGEIYYPFLQFRKEGELADFFCTCPASGRGCSHLAAAYLRIFNGQALPLHVRFEHSFWNQLCLAVAERAGFHPTLFTLSEEGAYVYLAKESGERLFSIHATTPSTQAMLHTILYERVEETEETSLKFSNLSIEEIAAWKSGRVSAELQYELSFWADLAKWCMFLSERPYQVSFLPSAPVPSKVELFLEGLSLYAYISEALWPRLIPSLSSLATSLQVVDEWQEAIERIEYDSLQRVLRIQCKTGTAATPLCGVQLGEWLYLEGKGFFRSCADPLLRDGVISSEKIADFLSQSGALLDAFLPMHAGVKSIQYELMFDEQCCLHIRPYLFEVGDLEEPGAALFAPWVYLPKEGFFKVHSLLFEEKESLIPKEEVAEFVRGHRHFLQKIPGFQLHLRSLESHLTYRVEPDKILFLAHLEFPEPFLRRIDFEEWIYIEGQGFYLRKEHRGNLPLRPGLQISKEEVSLFIASHREALEDVQGFFHSESSVRRRGLKVALNEEGRIALTIDLEYRPSVRPEELSFFGDFVYTPHKGFSEMTPLPDRYRTSSLIPVGQEAAFLSYELDSLMPYVTFLDRRLQRPKEIHFRVRKVVSEEKEGKTLWWVDCIYESDWGAVDLFSMWDRMQAKKNDLFSAAGLIWLKEPRWHWVRQLPRERFDRKRGLVRLQILDWIRLHALERVQPPFALEELEASHVLQMDRFPVSLRPYQETGLRWLWFLYCHGLSGLLCDDMGLGKTHQAMAFLAAVGADDERKIQKYLVVCPTSVMYHWQELLEKFLPQVRVLTYHGLSRSLDLFEAEYDLLLTSYGMLRSAQQEMKAISFTVAIYDEIQIAKNHTSQTHLALRSLHTRMRIGLTGTPIENRLRELKALFDLILPSYLPPDALFREQFIEPIEKMKSERAKGLLTQLIRPFILRRKKEEVLPDLPEKIEQIAYCDLSKEQEELYLATVHKMRSQFSADTSSLSSMHIFSLLATLKQICDHPALVHGDLKNYGVHHSGKWDLWLELLNEARSSGQKVVVFSQYLDMLSIIETHLQRRGIVYASLTGATKDRAYEIKRFREDPLCEVFVASLLAAGVGIDLTAASVVVHYDRWWNPAKENQATDRVYRIGQNRGVQVFKLVTKHTIEESIHELIEKKKGLIEELVGVQGLEPLTRDELLAIFQKVVHDDSI